jgi:hypothetical protein
MESDIDSPGADALIRRPKSDIVGLAKVAFHMVSVPSRPLRVFDGNAETLLTGATPTHVAPARHSPAHLRRANRTPSADPDEKAVHTCQSAGYGT